MAINPPVDATKTPEWAALQKHYDELQSEGISLKQWFADDAERVEKLSFDAGDLHFDLSKNLIKPETLQLFADLAKAVKLDERTKAMYTGVHINNTEDRAVLHTALRRPAEDEGKYIVDGQDTVKDVREVLGRIYAFADKVRSGEWTGVSGKKIETVVNIGIGGSDLGPVMVYEALKPYADAGISARYISNIDPNDLAEKTGLAVRTLAQSLLMSTAQPIVEKQGVDEQGKTLEGYYSVLQQGAGLANIGAAVNSGSYLMMDQDATDSYADGKIKAELGDDPQRTGEYSFGFTLYKSGEYGQHVYLKR